MKTQLIKRLHSFKWQYIILLSTFAVGFVSDPQIKSLIEQYPKQLGILLTVGTVASQITKWYSNIQKFKKEIKELETL